MGAPDPSRRWEGDDSGSGVSDAAALAPRLEALVEHARRPHWVAEEPEAHLWPHLRQAIDAPGTAWRLVSVTTDSEGRLVVELGYAAASNDERPAATLRAAALALVASVGEEATYVEVVSDGDLTRVDVITGSLDDQTPFRAHGHTLRLGIRRA